MSDTVFRVNAPGVVSEIIDGELVIMNLKSGKYYSSERCGAAIWAWIEAGKTLAQISRALCSEYDGDAAEIDASLHEFTDRLLREELVQVRAVTDSRATETREIDRVAGSKPRFAPPTLGTYTDMQDLLLLDPIHDVDETGWPTARPDIASRPA